MTDGPMATPCGEGVFGVANTACSRDNPARMGCEGRARRLLDLERHVVAPCARSAVPGVGPLLAGYPPQANERASPRLRPSSQRGDGHESADETRVTRR
jgi:hypothetical protein